MKRVIILFWLLLSVFFSLKAQIIYTKDSPLKLLTVQQMPELTLKPLDINKLQLEDLQHPIPYRVGVNFSFDKNLKQIAEKVVFGDKNIWYLHIKAQNGLAISVIFSDFYIPRGAKLFLYSADGKYVFGPITYRNNKKSKILPTRYLPTKDLIIEYQEPVKAEEGSLYIKSVVLYYRGVKIGKGIGDSEPCEVNINCPEGAAWQNEKNAVARILFTSGAYSYYCTGALVGNTAKTYDPYFLTANHCINKESEAQSAVFYFGLEANGCNDVPYNNGHTLSGSDLIASGKVNGVTHLDFSLLKLSSVPPISYNPYYAGWSRVSSAASIDSVVCIHHPQGDLKKISKSFRPLSVGSFTGYDQYSHWLISRWDVGATEGGSSGSPLFDNQRHIIGDLTGGQATCDNPVNDYFAQFYQSWDKYNDTLAQLKHWLDPLNINPLFINGYNPYNASGANLDPVRYIYGYAQGNKAHVFWLAPDQTQDSVFFDSFEDYQDFALSIPNWTQKDLDRGPTWGIDGVTFDNENYVGSFIVFNPNETTPRRPKGWSPHSGDKMLACFSTVPKYAPNNDWLITPKIPITPTTKLVFYAKSVSDKYPLDRIRVLVSTDSNRVEDFEQISTGDYVEVPTKWTRFEYDLSNYAGKKAYIAINVVSDSAFAFLLDDFSVSPFDSQALKTNSADEVTNYDRQGVDPQMINKLAVFYQPHLIGYDVYRDYKKIASLEPHQNYYVEQLDSLSDTYHYFVVAVYDSGSAYPSSPVTIKFLQDTVSTYMHDNAVTVFPNPATNGTFTLKFIRTMEKGRLIITSLSGKVIRKQNIVNQQVIEFKSLPIQAGVYIIYVQTDTENYKTILINL